MKKSVLLFILTFYSFSLFAKGNLMFEKANELYRNKNYDSASTLYTKLIESNYCSPELFYNAGNAYYRNNQIGLAVWAYRTAMNIKYDKNLSDNYQLALKKISMPIIHRDEIFFIRWWRFLYSFFSINIWCIIAAISFFTYLSFLYFKKIKNKNISSWMLSSFIFISVACICLATIHYYNAQKHYEAVVLNESTAILEQQNEEQISEGIIVRVINTKVLKGRNYLQVRLPDGREAFLPEKNLRKIGL